MANKTVISVQKPTPQWATWVFRAALLIGSTVNTAIVSAPRISEAVKLDIIYWSGILVTIVWGLSRIVGVDVDEPKWKLK